VHIPAGAISEGWSPRRRRHDHKFRSLSECLARRAIWLEQAPLSRRFPTPGVRPKLSPATRSLGLYELTPVNTVETQKL
jgi:hypothetical protein